MQLLLMTIFDTTAGIGNLKVWQKEATHQTDGQTDVKVEIVIYIFLQSGPQSKYAPTTLSKCILSHLITF